MQSLRKFRIALALLVLQTVVLGTGSAQASRVLFAFGPGGPYAALTACAELFRQETGVTVAVLRARPEELPGKLREYGDLYYGGAEYMLEELAADNPGMLDLDTATKLHPRRIGVVVRKGNPHGIGSVWDLAELGVELLAVRLEKMESFHPALPDGGDNVHRWVQTGQEGLYTWRNTPELDAWVTYRSWHRLLEDEVDFIDIPCHHAVRYTPMALTRHTPHRQQAQEFIAFLQTPEARRIFEAHGWY